MNIVEKRLDQIQPYDNNPRKNDNAVPYVAESIKRYGFKVPIIIDKDGVIVAGHTRYLASIELGLDKVPCIVADDLTDEQIREFRLVDNKVSEFAGWDVEMLEIELEDLDFDGFDFGFDIEHIEPEPEVAEDDYTEENVQTRCKLGDIWQLGNHRLICGDSTDVSVIDRLMDGVKADIAFTSPPYNAGKSASLTGNTHMTECKYENGDDNLTDYDELLIGATDNMLMFSKWAFINLQMLANNKVIICEWLNNYKDFLCDIAIWYKNATAPAMAERVMNSQFEFIFIFGNDNNSRAVGTKTFRGTVSNVYQGSAQRKNEYAEVHSATFPVEFVSHFVSNFTEINDVVLDCFGGTGTTMIACEQLNRKCFMCELDEHYCDVIIDRWEQFTGKKAVLINE